MEELTLSSLRKFVEFSPLYAPREFSVGVWKPSSLWIHEIEAHCPACKKEKPYHNTEKVILSKVILSSGSLRASHPTKMESGIYNLEFKCVSCIKKVTIWIKLVVKESNYTLEKVGESPRKPLNRDPILQKFFSDELDCYERALVCISNGYGIGAFAYMRRITENRIESLIQLVKDELESSGSNHGLGDKLEELRNDSPMSDKIRIANEAMPDYLNPHGLNPLGRIYKALSEGIHSRSESECLESANNLMESIKYLVGELNDRSRNRDQYRSVVSKL